MSKQTEAPSKEISTLNVTAKKLYSELAELQSDIDVLLQQLQSLSSQRLMLVGSAN
jgi:chaperonin cofactor prefoldin